MEGGPKAEFMVKIEMCTLSVLACMAVAGTCKVGRDLHKERVGIYNVGIMSVEISSESVDGC